MCQYAGERGFTNLIILGQGLQLGGHKKLPCSMLLVHLPEGPVTLGKLPCGKRERKGGTKKGEKGTRMPRLVNEMEPTVLEVCLVLLGAVHLS